MSGTFVIKVAYGGLGDHLFLSHLPRIAKTTGAFSKVLVSSQSEYRNPAYRHLVWELNPYVDGFTDEDAPLADIRALPAGHNLLDMIMLQRNLDDGQRFHEPEIYYKPRVNAEFSNLCVYDPNFISYVGEIDGRQVTKFLRRQAGPVAQLRLRERSIPAALPVPVLETKSIYDYCDLIHSCGTFVCLASGGATLAAAVGRPALVLFGRGQKREFHHSKRHRYLDMSSPWWRHACATWPGKPARLASRMARLAKAAVNRLAGDRN